MLMGDEAAQREIGELRGRMNAMEGRMDRHEDFVGKQLGGFAASFDRLASDTRSGTDALRIDVGSIKLLLATQNGERAASARDVLEAERKANEAEHGAFNRKNVQLMFWSVLAGWVMAIIGVAGIMHPHMF